MPRAGLRWGSVPRARGWVVEIAADAEFVLDLSVHDAEKRKWVPDRGPGHWYWRVAAVDDDGFVGRWSPVHGFDVE